jgi:hypothetical protein
LMAACRTRRNDAKLEAFAQELAKGKSAPESARVVGYTGSSLADNAKKRSRLPSVRARVAELRALAAEQCVLTVERLIGESEEARLKAMAEKGGASAAISAVQTKAKLAGLWREKVDQHNIDTDSLAPRRLETYGKNAPQTGLPGNNKTDSYADPPPQQ